MQMEQEDSLHLGDLTFYRLELYANLLIATAANSLGIWLILYSSPKHMRIYRWFLLDMLLSAFCMDFYMFTILQPLILLPIPGYCPLGIAHYGGTFFGAFISLLILFFLLGCYTASTLSASAFRLLSVYNLQHKFLSPRGFWSIFCLHLFITAPLQIAAGFVIKEIDGDWQMAIRDKMAQLHPNIRKILDSNELCVFLSIEITEVQATIYIAIGLMVIVGIVGIGIIVLGFYSLVLRKNKYSNKLYQMHMQLSFSLLGQLMVPFFTLLVPFFILALSFLLKLPFIEDLAQIYVMTFSMHSTLNALAMILFTRPYRDTVKKWLTQWILRPFMKKNKIVPKTDDPFPKTIAMATERIDGQNQHNELVAGIKTIMVKEKVEENGAIQINGVNIRRNGGSGRRIIGHLKNPMDGRQSVPITLVG